MSESQLLPAVSSFLSSPRQLLIDGEWVDAKDGQTFDTVNPATEDVLVQVAQASAVDADRAVVAARNAFEAGSPWQRMTPRERSHLLWRIGDAIDERAEEFARSVLRSEAVVRLSPEGVRLLPYALDPTSAKEGLASSGTPDGRGWVTLTLPVESEEVARIQLRGLGPEVEVLAPEALRKRCAEDAAAAAALYRSPTA